MPIDFFRRPIECGAINFLQSANNANDGYPRQSPRRWKASDVSVAVSSYCSIFAAYAEKLAEFLRWRFPVSHSALCKWSNRLSHGGFARFQSSVGTAAPAPALRNSNWNVKYSFHFYIQGALSVVSASATILNLQQFRLIHIQNCIWCNILSLLSLKIFNSSLTFFMWKGFWWGLSTLFRYRDWHFGFGISIVNFIAIVENLIRVILSCWVLGVIVGSDLRSYDIFMNSYFPGVYSK